MEKAFILISCNIGKEKFLYDELRKIPEITNCLITYGDYDIVAEFETDSAAQMDDLITNKIRKLGMIRSTITLRVFV